MNIKINKTAAQILSILMLTFYLMGSAFIYLYYAQKGNIALSNSEVLRVFLVAPLNFLQFFGQIIIGFWLYFQAEKLNLYKWTWFLLGLVGGTPILILFFLHLMLQEAEPKSDFVPILRNALIIALIAFGIKIIGRFFGIAFETSFMSKISQDLYLIRYKVLSTVTLFKTFEFVVLNLILALILYRYSRKKSLQNSTFWIISTLLLGPVAFILHHILLLVSNKKEVTETINDQLSI